MEGRTWTIYSLADPLTGQIRYVGITICSIKKRFGEHISRAKGQGRTHRDCWIKSLLAKGLLPIIAALEQGIGDQWQDRERHWIAELRKTNDLVNLTDGGEGTPGFKMPRDAVEKIAAMKRGTKYPPGRKSAMFGKHHSPQAVEKIRLAGTGRHHTEESRKKVSRAKMGKLLSEEHRAKLKAWHSGKTLSEEHKNHIAASTTNRKPVLCVETGQVFASITAAAHHYGVTETTVNQSVRKGVRCKGYCHKFA